MADQDRPYLQFRNSPHAAEILKNWHTWLQSDRGARAAMRRARSVDEVWMEEAYSRLRLPLLKAAKFKDDALARVAIAVAEVDKDADEDLASRAAASTHRAKTTVSPDRIRLLLGAQEPEEFLRLLRGVLHMIDREVSLTDIGDIVLASHNPNGRAMNRKRVMLRFYETADTSVL